MIPFLEHDDANRALMGQHAAPGGAAGQVEARWSAPAWSCAPRSTVATCRRPTRPGCGGPRPADHITVMDDDGTRTATSCASSPAPTTAPAPTSVRSSTRGSASRPARSSPTVPHRRTVRWRWAKPLVAIMPWGGPQLRGRDHPEPAPRRRRTCSPRSTSRSTRSTPATPSSARGDHPDIPNVSDEVLADLDERGIVRIGAEVRDGDILSARSRRRARPS